jgi:hypothetical protein
MKCGSRWGIHFRLKMAFLLIRVWKKGNKIPYFYPCKIIYQVTENPNANLTFLKRKCNLKTVKVEKMKSLSLISRVY